MMKNSAANVSTNVSILTPDALLQHWQGHRRLTRRVIEAFPDDQLFHVAGAAIVIAAPAAWLLNNLWLEQFANRVALGPDFIGFSTAVLLVLAMLAVGSQILRATRANPVDSLRWE